MPPNWDGFSIGQSTPVRFHRYDLFAIIRFSHASLLLKIGHYVK